MDNIERKLAALNLVLPAPVTPPAGVESPFSPVRGWGDRAYMSGHDPQNSDGALG